MRNIVVALVDIFGRQHNSEINGYVSQQWIRESNYENCQFGLNDIDEQRLTNSILRLIKCVGLTAGQFLNGIMIRGYVDNRGSIAPLFGVKSSLYADLLSDVAKIDIQLVYPGDEIEYSGKSKHVIFNKRDKNTAGDSVGGFINGVTKEGEMFSLLIHQDEWEAIIKSYEEVKCNGTVYVDANWDENIQKGFLCHRLIDEFIGSVLNDECIESYELYRAIVDFENAYYLNETSTTELVFSKRGYKLGETVKLFGEVDVLAAKKAGKTSIKSNMKVVVDNSKNKSRVTSKKVAGGQSQKHVVERKTFNDNTFVEWGEF
jgi:hypothetical protein